MSMERVSSIMISGVESAAQMSIGQAILKVVDKIMWIVEKSVQWSLPIQDTTAEENGKSFGKVELVRPLPWILFLPSLLMLRIVRIGINTSASILGYPPVEPTDMIRVIQRGRRRLRAIKSSGLKNMRQKKVPVTKDRTMTMKEASKSLAKSLRLTLSTLSCLDSGSNLSPSPPPTKIHFSSIFETAISPVSEERTNAEITDLMSPSKTDIKRKFDEIGSSESEEESDSEPLIDKINRLANEMDSDEDKSYIPSDSSPSSDTTDSEADVSMTEIKELLSSSEEVAGSRRVESISIPTSNDFHKLTDGADVIVEPTPAANAANKDDIVNDGVIDNILIKAKAVSTPNGVMDTNGEQAFYSPVSWKSMSPDLSFSPDKQDKQNDADGKVEELTNGKVNKDKDVKNHESTKPTVAASEAAINGLLNEKQNSSSNHGGHNKHNKNKSGKQGNRKKK